MMQRYSIFLILSLLTIPVYANDPSNFELEVPLVYVYSSSSKALTTEEFISASYQPVVVTRALHRKIQEDLKPWDFAHLATSLEAATTFCIAESEVPNSAMETQEKAEFADVMLEKESENINTENGRNEERNNRKEMSLRRFVLEGKDIWAHAFANITKEMGMMMRLPKFLEDFDFDTVETLGLQYTRSGVSSQTDKSSQSFSSASVICLLEGVVSFILTPFDLPWDQVSCGKDSCLLDLNFEVSEALATKLFFTRVDLQSRDCLYMPIEWQWQSSSFVDSISLRIIWEEDLSIREEVLEKLVEEENLLDENYNSPNEQISTRNPKSSKPTSKMTSKTLWEVLPRTFWQSPILWSEKNPLLHLVRLYLLSSQERNLADFLRDFRVDRGILPDLVDCPKECVASARRIFTLLDTNEDGVLSRLDAIYLSQDTFTALTLEMDDLVDELKELGVEQWISVVEGGGDTKFMDRAKDRMQEGAKVIMRRLMAGDIDEKEELQLQEKLPGLYADVIAARAANKAKIGKEEL